MAKLTDRDLVDRAKSGDNVAFGQLVRRHQPRIHRLAVHMLRDRAEAEDVTQETFIRAYQALARFDDPRGQASRKEVYFTLCEGIDKLSETLRTTLILVCIDGRSHEDAAQILGAPEGTIAWRVHEARRKLREFLSERGFDLEEGSL